MRSALREMRFWEDLSPEDQLYFHMPIRGFASEQQLERDRIPDSRAATDGSGDTEDHSAAEEDHEGAVSDYDSDPDADSGSDENDFGLDEDPEPLYMPEEDASKSYNLFA